MLKRFLSFLLFIYLILLIGCASKPVEVIEEIIDPVSYYNDTKSLLYNETDENFWVELNRNSSEFPEKTALLLKDYSNYQKDLIQYYLDKEEPDSAAFHLNNLFSVPEDVDSFTTIKSLREQIELMSFQLMENRRNELFAKGTPISEEVSDLTDFNNSLAEIHVQYHWENLDGIERFNKNDMAGSGFLITPTHVLTAFHVVSDVFDDDILNYEISIHFGDDIINDVKIISWDSLTDLAVLELPSPSNLPFLYNQLLDDNEMKQGDVVYTLGHPYGYSYTFSRGVISSAARKAPEWGNWIQIDASVGPGSSGGLLINENGRIAGLVVAGLSGEELNFAVPSGLIKKEIDGMINGISLKRPWSGLMFKNQGNNTILHHIFEESPFIHSGLEQGDELIKINNLEIESLEAAKSVMDNLEAGNMVSMTFLRDDIESTYRIRMMRRPDYAIYNKIARMDIFERILVASGATLQSETTRMEGITLGSSELSFPSFQVEKIDENSSLYSLGVRVGDSLGLIEDYFENYQYFLTMIHIPENMELINLIDPRDMIFTITKDKYNEFIL